MNYKQIQSGDILSYPMSFCDGITDMPIVVEYCDSPKHAVTHNHDSAKHLMEVCGVMIELADDIMIDVPFLHANEWTEEYRIYSTDKLRGISWERIVEETTYEYMFRIHNSVWHRHYDGRLRTIRELQHILRDCGMEDIANDLKLPKV